MNESEKEKKIVTCLHFFFKRLVGSVSFFQICRDNTVLPIVILLQNISCSWERLDCSHPDWAHFLWNFRDVFNSVADCNLDYHEMETIVHNSYPSKIINFLLDDWDEVHSWPSTYKVLMDLCAMNLSESELSAMQVYYNASANPYPKTNNKCLL